MAGKIIIKIGNLKIGKGFPVRVQSMTNTPTWNIEKTCLQIKKLEKAGCEIVRVGIPDMKSARAIGRIKSKINIPLVADIHFSADLALESIKQGADKIRINPGNFPKSRLAEIVKACRNKNIPVRIGINAGSLEKSILKKHRKATPEMMVKSALRSIKLMENLNFRNLVVSLKASDVVRTVKAYKMLSEKTDYPLHLGVTEAGGEFSGTVKSAVALGYLLLEGIGDTIRVSLSEDPVKEVKVGWEILKSLGLRERGATIISCPTCARTQIDVIKISKQVEKEAEKIKKPLKIAVMGCIVNGLGEAKEADLAIVGLKNQALIVKKGKTVRKTALKNILKEFKKELKNFY
jgi:(E)-4-hydroxy-3-methylbut-2-enyl-diphosphate synthase